MSAGLVLVLALALPGRPQDDLAEQARVLLEDLTSWREGAPPEGETVRALCDEVTRLAQEPAPPSGTDPLGAVLRALGSLGHRLGELGRDVEARAVVVAAGEAAEARGVLVTASWAWEWLGQEAWVRNEFEGAARWTLRAAEVDRRRAASDDRTRHLADLARIRAVQGRFELALAAAEEAEGVAQAGGSPLAKRTAAAALGGLLFELGRPREALDACLAASPPEGSEPPHDESQVRLDVLAADVLADVGRLESALVFARRARAVAHDPAVQRVAPLLFLEAEMSLGLLLGDLGETAEAVQVLDGVEAECRRLGDARGEAWAAKNRAYARFAAGQLAAALPDFERAWQAGAALDVPFLEGFGAMGVAEALVLRGAPAEPERLAAALAAAERVASRLVDRTLEWRCAALRGRLRLEEGACEAALGELREAVRLIERWRRRLGASGLVEHALRQRTDPYRDAAFAAARLGRTEEALAFAGLLQARVLDELRARRSGPLPAPSSPALEELRARVARLQHRVAEDEDAEARLALERAEDELDAALLTEELESGRVLARPGGRLPLERVAAGLEREGLARAVTYLTGERESLALCLGAGSAPRVEALWLPVGRPELDALVARVRTPLDRLESGALDLAHLDFDVEAARTLERVLVAPLGLEPGSAVALVLDDALAALPFELLVSAGEPGPLDFRQPFAHLAGLRFFGDEHALVRYASLARLADPVPAREGPAVVCAAPAAVGPAGAAEEARAVVRARGGGRVLLDASVATVLEAASGAGLVHFAAHGLVDPARPAHGSLRLGGGADGGPSRLESWQAAELDLAGALVVLSACDSGRGAWRAGAGRAGLVRGFQLAGAREVVASLWAVDDRVTLRFMELFHAAHARGVDAAEALRAARVTLRGETDPRGFALAHPAFWAAWTLER